MSEQPAKSTLAFQLRKNFVAGLFVLTPIAITVVALSFLFDMLSRFGRPLVTWLESSLREAAVQLAKPETIEQTTHRGALFLDGLARAIGKPIFLDVIGVMLVVAAVCALGWFATRVVGRRILTVLERIVEQIPLVKTVYGATKQLLAAFQQQPDGVQRVVLIDFPHENAKCVGLVTRTFRDIDTGRELAAVYVPTTPNPTSGYLEVVPVEKLVNTNWTVNEAMTFIVSGGSVAPSQINFDRSASREKVQQPKSPN